MIQGTSYTTINDLINCGSPFAVLVILAGVE